MPGEVKPAHKDFQQYVIKQGLEYGVAGAILGVCVNGIALRRIPAWPKAPMMVRSAFIVGCTAGPFVYGSMQASIKYEREEDMKRERELRGISSSESLQKKSPEADVRTTFERARDKFLEYKYQCIGAGWITGVAVSAMAIWRDKLMNNQQKVVQIRVYAQAITVVLILGAVWATISAENAQERKLKQGGDTKHHAKMYGAGTDDWQILAKEEENRERKQGIPISLHEQKEQQQQQQQPPPPPPPPQGKQENKT